MQIPQAIRQQACEGLLHFVPKKALARELGISRGSVRDWAIYIEHGFFDWIDKPWRTRRPELMQKAVETSGCVLTVQGAVECDPKEVKAVGANF